MPTLDNAHALVVGIAAYDTDRLDSLPATRRDSQDIYDLLIDPQYCAYPKSNVQLVQDPEATKDNLLGGFEELAERSDADSNVFIYVSCHGGRVESGEHAGEYLLPFDTDYTSAATVAETAISGETFSDALRAIPARKVAVFSDACHAGGIGQPKSAAAARVKKGLSEDYYRALATGRGRVIIASSRETEESWIIPRDARNSLFTKHLLDGLRGGVASEDGFVNVFNLFEYLQPKVTEDEPNQHPIFASRLEENFPIALYRGGEKGTVQKDEQGFRYDAYVSYVDKEPDASWVWDKLVPYLEGEGVRVAVSGDVEEPGVARVVSTERGIKQSKRTIVVLSEAYLDDHMADFQNVLGQSMGVQEGTYRLLPVKMEPIEEERLPVRLSQLVTLNLYHPRRAKREFDRLIAALKGPLPKMGV